MPPPVAADLDVPEPILQARDDDDAHSVVPVPDPPARALKVGFVLPSILPDPHTVIETLPVDRTLVSPTSVNVGASIVNARDKLWGVRLEIAVFHATATLACTSNPAVRASREPATLLPTAVAEVHAVCMARDLPNLAWAVPTTTPDTMPITVTESEPVDGSFIRTSVENRIAPLS